MPIVVAHRRPRAGKRTCARILLACALSFPLVAQSNIPSLAPDYTAEGIANSAAGVTGLYAPNTFLTIYGRDLSFVTKAITNEDIRAGRLPDVLIGTGVRVLVNSVSANIYYVSPGQVNILLPTSLLPGTARLRVINDGRAGPEYQIPLRDAAPALFQFPGTDRVIATHGLGPVVTPEDPASPGEIVVLYGTGFGPTNPSVPPNRLPTEAAQLRDRDRFQVWLNSQPVDPANILYAGITPYYAGLFQINLLVPADAPANPEIRIGYPQHDDVPAMMSPPGRVLPVASN